jgi:hypothetical protein
MLTTIRGLLQRGGWVALLMVSAALIDAPAHAAPFGLQVGDEVSSIEFDALQSVAGDGASWDVSQMLFHADGRITAVNLDAGGSLYPTNTDLTFDLGLAHHNVYMNLLHLQAYTNAYMPGYFNPNPSFSIADGSGVILNGTFVGNVFVDGNVDLSNGAQSLSASGIIAIAGGDADLVNALGGIGANALLLLDQTLFGFTPALLNLLGVNTVPPTYDGNAWNSNFTVSLTGTVAPFNPSPFVPEPSTALLVGAGMLGMLGLSRRIRRRC